MGFRVRGGELTGLELGGDVGGRVAADILHLSNGGGALVGRGGGERISGRLGAEGSGADASHLLPLRLALDGGGGVSLLGFYCGGQAGLEVGGDGSVRVATHLPGLGFRI